MMEKRSTIRNYFKDVVIIVTSASTCSLTSATEFVVMANPNKRTMRNNINLTLTALTDSSAQLWVKAICAVIENLAFHPDGRASSAEPEEMIRRPRFDLLQTILIHHRNSGYRLRVAKDIMQIVAGYIFKELEPDLSWAAVPLIDDDDSIKT